MSARTTSPDRDRIEAVATALCRVAYDAHVELPLSYARRVTAATMGSNAGLDLSRLGGGVVIRTVPGAKDRLPAEPPAEAMEIGL
jgi:hypothetical protein